MPGGPGRGGGRCKALEAGAWGRDRRDPRRGRTLAALSSARRLGLGQVDRVSLESRVACAYPAPQPPRSMPAAVTHEDPPAGEGLRDRAHGAAGAAPSLLMLTRLRC